MGERFEGEILEGREALPCAGEVEVPGHGAGGGNATDSGGLGGFEAIEGVLENDGLGVGDAELGGGVEKEAWVRFDVAGVVDGREMVELGAELEAVHPHGDPVAGAARGDGGAQSEAVGFGESIQDTGQRLEGASEFDFALAALSLEGGPVEGAAGSLFEVAARIVSGFEIGAHEGGIGFDGEGVSFGLEDFAPGMVADALGVDDEAVEIEDDGAEARRHERGLMGLGFLRLWRGAGEAQEAENLGQTGGNEQGAQNGQGAAPPEPQSFLLESDVFGERIGVALEGASFFEDLDPLGQGHQSAGTEESVDEQSVGTRWGAGVRVWGDGDFGAAGDVLISREDLDFGEAEAVLKAFGGLDEGDAQVAGREVRDAQDDGVFAGVRAGGIGVGRDLGGVLEGGQGAEFDLEAFGKRGAVGEGGGGLLGVGSGVDGVDPDFVDGNGLSPLEGGGSGRGIWGGPEGESCFGFGA